MNNQEIFLEYAKEVKALGYRVFIKNNESCHYGYIVNDKDEIGYFQLNDFGFGVRFSTRHKPNGEFGCGFGLDTWDNPKTSPLTRKDVDRIFIHHPDWARPFGKLHTIKKWTATEYLNNKSVYGCGNDITEI